MIARLPHDWTLSGDYTWNRSTLLTEAGFGFINTFGIEALFDSTLDVMRDLNLYPLDLDPYRSPYPSYIFGPADAILKQGSLRASGLIFELPGGPIVLSAMAERRQAHSDLTFEEAVSNIPDESAGLLDCRRQAENRLRLPGSAATFVLATNGMRFSRALELQLSVRYDDYSTTAPEPASGDGITRDDPLPDMELFTNNVSETSYTFGMRYQPSHSLILRASVGTGFLPPGIDVITVTPGTCFNPIVADHKRGGVPAPLGVIPCSSGGNPDLLSEDSKSWSAGLIFNPQFLSNLRLSLDYTNIRKSNEIQRLLNRPVSRLGGLLAGTRRSHR